MPNILLKAQIGDHRLRFKFTSKQPTWQMINLVQCGAMLLLQQFSQSVYVCGWQPAHWLKGTFGRDKLQCLLSVRVSMSMSFRGAHDGLLMRQKLQTFLSYKSQNFPVRADCSDTTLAACLIFIVDHNFTIGVHLLGPITNCAVRLPCCKLVYGSGLTILRIVELAHTNSAKQKSSDAILRSQSALHRGNPTPRNRNMPHTAPSSVMTTRFILGILISLPMTQGVEDIQADLN